MYALDSYGYVDMSKPRVYTQRTSISMRREHREEFEAALPEDSSLGGKLRDAGLRFIGMSALVIPSDKPETRRFWNNEAGAEAPPWVFLAVNFTLEQKTVLHDAANERSLSLSALLQDALRLELGLPLSTEAAKGWKRGKRRSEPPVNEVKVRFDASMKRIEVNGSEMTVTKAGELAAKLAGKHGGVHKLVYEDAQWVFYRSGRGREAIRTFTVLEASDKPRAKARKKR